MFVKRIRFLYVLTIRYSPREHRKNRVLFVIYVSLVGGIVAFIDVIASFRVISKIRVKFQKPARSLKFAK